MIQRAGPAREMRASPRYYPAHPILATVLEGDFPIAQALVTNISVSGARLITDVSIGRGVYVRLSLWRRNELFLKTDALVLWRSTTTTEAGDALQGVLFTQHSTSFRQHMERLLVPPAFLKRNLAKTNPLRTSRTNDPVKKTPGGQTPGSKAPFGDEVDRVKNVLLRDFESISFMLRKD